MKTSATKSKNAQGTGRRERQTTSGSRGETPSAVTASSSVVAIAGGSHCQVSTALMAATSQAQAPAISTASATIDSAAVASETGTSASLSAENAGGGDNVFQSRRDGQDHRQPDRNAERPDKPIRRR